MKGCGKLIDFGFVKVPCGQRLDKISDIIYCDECRNKDVGVKYDGGKLDWSLVPFEEIEEVVKVLQFGKDKYGKDNWKKIEDSKDRYFAAAMRHIMLWKKKIIHDHDSGYHHLAHAISCLLFLIWYDSNDLVSKMPDDVLANHIKGGV